MRDVISIKFFTTEHYYRPQTKFANSFGRTVRNQFAICPATIIPKTHIKQVSALNQQETTGILRASVAHCWTLLCENLRKQDFESNKPLHIIFYAEEELSH